MKKILIILVIILLISGVAFFVMTFLDEEREEVLEESGASYCESHNEARIETINGIVDNWNDIAEGIPPYFHLEATGNSNSVPVRYQFIGNNKVHIAFTNYDGEEIVPLGSLIGFDCENEEATNFTFFRHQTMRFPFSDEWWTESIEKYGVEGREVNNYMRPEDAENYKEWVEVEENLFLAEE